MMTPVVVEVDSWIEPVYKVYREKKRDLCIS